MIIESRPGCQAGAKTLAPQRPFAHRLSVSVLTVVSALIVLGPVGSAAAQSSAPRTDLTARGATPAGVTLQTEEPELTEADRSLLINVRLAGLWEIPAGKMAMQKGVSPRVRQIGQMIAAQHVRLDDLNKTAAKAVGVALPDRPTSQQVRWLGEMEGAEGALFDDIYVMRLRAAHGKIFPVIGAVRSSTQNDVVRNLAQSANNFVLTHISLLESTGLVSYAELPKAEALATEGSNAAARRSRSGGVAVPVIWMILATALIAGAVVTARMIRPANLDGERKGRRQAGSPDPVGTGLIPVQSEAGGYPQQGLRLRGGSRSRP